MTAHMMSGVSVILAIMVIVLQLHVISGVLLSFSCVMLERRLTNVCGEIPHKSVGSCSVVGAYNA